MNLQQAKFLIEDHENSESVSMVIDSLLSSVSAQESAPALRSTALFVRDVSILNPNVCHVLILHLATLPDPLSFIEVVPSMFAVAAAPLVQEICRQLVGLMSTRPDYLLPCMAALLELPLPELLKPQVSRVTERAIAAAAAVDLPKLFRILFKSIGALDASRTVGKLRSQVNCYLVMCYTVVLCAVAAKQKVSF